MPSQDREAFLRSQKKCTATSDGRRGEGKWRVGQTLGKKGKRPHTSHTEEEGGGGKRPYISLRGESALLDEAEKERKRERERRERERERERKGKSEDGILHSVRSWRAEGADVCPFREWK